MNEFLNALEQALSGLDAGEKREILDDYREHFALGLAAGKTEEEIAASLGDPAQLAAMYTAAHRARHGGFADAMRMIGTALRFRVGGGILMGTLYFLCFGVIAVLYIVAAALIVTAVGCVVLAGAEVGRGYGAYAVLASFTALLFASGGLLWISGNTRLWKACAARLPLTARRIMKLHGAKEVL
jgi:uncharacterized membrane protein